MAEEEPIDCRGLSHNPSVIPTCIDASRAFNPGEGCETNRLCYYESPIFIPYDAPCALTGNTIGPHATRCTGMDGPGSRPPTLNYHPLVCVWPLEDEFDADGDIQPWMSLDVLKSFLNSPVQLQYDACVPEDFCTGVGEPLSHWVSRIAVYDGQGWRLWCTDVLHCAEPPCDQTQLRQLAPLYPDGNGYISFVEFLLGSHSPYCFGGLADHHCFRAYCGHEDPKLTSCIGDVEPKRARALDRLYLTADWKYGDGCHFLDSTQIEYLNAMWSTLADQLDQLDAPGHQPFLQYGSNAVSRWVHNETFGVTRVIEISVGGTIDEQTFTITMNSQIVASYVAQVGDTYRDVVNALVVSWNNSPYKDSVDAYEFDDYLILQHQVTGETFTVELNEPGEGATFTQQELKSATQDPAVQGTAIYYPSYDEEDIPITCRGSASGYRYTCSATLTIQKVGIVFNLHVEKGVSGTGALYRVIADGVVRVWVRVKLDSGAYSAPEAIRVDVGGTIDNQLFTISMNETVVASYTAEEGDTYSDVVNALIDSWNASGDKGEIDASRKSGYIILRHRKGGVEFTVELNTPGEGATFTQQDYVITPPYEFLNPSDPFDLTIKDPNNPTQPHPREKILAVGPNGERIWRQEDTTPETGAMHYWRALKTDKHNSMGPDDFEEVCDAPALCCGVLHAINDVVISGETNDNTGLEDIRFRTVRLTVGGTLNGETFEVWVRRPGNNFVKICEFTDTSHDPSDVATAIAQQWNASENEWTTTITASADGAVVSLVPDYLDHPNTDIWQNSPGGSATFEWEQDEFVILPQEYEGDVSFTVPGITTNDYGCQCA